ncbi:hypothetical protein V7S43_000007 [Phytophthora oleae]|uniref:Uncharacterized protein n=1 Tax=Phytophthora oleae TaxID=2107226 RepID=A0ABD3G4J9_9STRA
MELIQGSPTFSRQKYLGHSAVIRKVASPCSSQDQPQQPQSQRLPCLGGRHACRRDQSRGCCNTSSEMPCFTLPSPASVALLRITVDSLLTTKANTEAIIRLCMGVGLLPASCSVTPHHPQALALWAHQIPLLAHVVQRKSLCVQYEGGLLVPYVCGYESECACVKSTTSWLSSISPDWSVCKPDQEVMFEIDANGILDVSAREQKH